MFGLDLQSMLRTLIQIFSKHVRQVKDLSLESSWEFYQAAINLRGIIR